MTELSVVARLKAKRGREAEVELDLRALVAPTHKERGCLRYALHRSVEDRGAFVFVERWASKEAFDQHLAAPYIQAFLKKVPDLLTSPPEIAVFELLPEGLPEKGRL